MISKCSAVVLSYNRVGNLRRIVANLRAQPFVDDVVVCHQGEPLPSGLAAELGGAVLRGTVLCRRNELRLGRFKAMDECRHDAVLVQDDDVLPHRLADVWAAWTQDDLRIAALLPSGHWRTDDRRHWSVCHEVLLGWGAVLDRRWRAVLREWTDRWGEDDLLRRKADRVFSMLLRREHTIIKADCERLPGDDVGAEWRRPDHDEATAEARRRVLNEILGLDVPRFAYTRR